MILLNGFVNYFQWNGGLGAGGLFGGIFLPKRESLLAFLQRKVALNRKTKLGLGIFFMVIWGPIFKDFGRVPNRNLFIGIVIKNGTAQKNPPPNNFLIMLKSGFLLPGLKIVLKDKTFFLFRYLKKRGRLGGA